MPTYLCEDRPDYSYFSYYSTPSFHGEIESSTITPAITKDANKTVNNFYCNN